MLKDRLLFRILLRKIFYFICKHNLIKIIITFLRLILLFDSLIATLFFLVIIAILLNGDPNGNKQL